MDIEGDLFDKESSTVELIVEDILFDTNEDLQKTLFASLDSIIVPLSPRPAPRVVANKIDNGVPSSDELDGTSTFTSHSTAGNNGQLKHLVGSHELGLSIQQETPQLLMEGDTLDDQDAGVVQEMSPYEQDFAKMLVPAAVDTTHKRTNDVHQLPMKVSNKSIGLPVAISSQSTNNVTAPLESNLCMGISGKVTASTPAAHVSSPSPIASSPSVSNLTSFLDHVSSPLVAMNSPITSASYSPNTISCALKLLARAGPYSVISSSLLSLNKPVTNEVSTPSTMLSTTTSSSIPSSTPLTTLSSTPSTTSSTSPMPSPTTSSIQSSTMLSTTSSSMPSSTMLSSTSIPSSASSTLLSSFHHHDTTNNTVNLAAPIAENDADNFRDDIIGQSLMLAHNAVHSSPDQPLASHDPSHQGSHKQPDCTRSHNQRGSHDQHNQLGSHDQQMDWEIGCPESHDAYDGVTKSTASIIPSKITFIDWTEMKRKHVTPSYYSSTPTPINVRLDQDDTISAPHSKKKKKSDTNPTGKKRGWVKGRPRKTPALKSIIKQMPKPPRSGYMYYLSDYRSEMMKNNPNMSMREISNHLGKTWGQLPVEQRQSYLNKGYVDRQRYIQELVTYYQQKNNDFQQQDPTFDPEWATKYLTQYLSNNSDDTTVLYCPVCDVQFSSLHNKQQHCLSRKHNKEVVTFVQESVKKHQKKNGNVSTSTTHPANINNENSVRDHLSSNTSSVDHIAGTEDSIADHMSNNVDHLSSNDHMRSNINHMSSNMDHMNSNVNHMSSNVDHMSSNVDHVNNTEDHVRINSNDAKDHKRYAEHQVNSTEDHMGAAEDSIAGVNHHTRDHEDSINLSSRETSLSSDTMSDTNASANASNGTTADSPTCSSVDHCNNDEISSVPCHTNDPDCIILTDTENKLSSDTLSDTDGCTNTNTKDNMILTDSCACSSSVDHSNNDEASVGEGPCDQPFVCFPSYYGLNHLMHDFTLHQQGMLNSLSEANSQLHSRHAQLQGDGNELEAQVEDMEKQLQCSRQENIGLLSQLEILSYMIQSIGQQEDNA